MTESFIAVFRTRRPASRPPCQCKTAILSHCRVKLREVFMHGKQIVLAVGVQWIRLCCNGIILHLYYHSKPRRLSWPSFFTARSIELATAVMLTPSVPAMSASSNPNIIPRISWRIQGHSGTCCNKPSHFAVWWRFNYRPNAYYVILRVEHNFCKCWLIIRILVR